MATNNSTNQPQSDYRPEANYENPDAVSAKDRMLILTIVIVLLVLAAMAVLGFLFIKQGPCLLYTSDAADEVLMV